MGYTFAAALVKKTGGTAPATRKAFRVAMENREGAVHHVGPRVKLKATPFWLKEIDE